MGAPPASTDDAPSLTPHIDLRTVIMLVNPLSGGVGANAVQEAEAILSAYACDASVVAL